MTRYHNITIKKLRKGPFRQVYIQFMFGRIEQRNLLCEQNDVLAIFFIEKAPRSCYSS